MIYDITPLKVLETDLKKACDIRTLILLMSGHFFRRFVKNSMPGNSTKYQHELLSSLSEILEGVGYEMGVHMISLYQRTANTEGLPQISEKSDVSTPIMFLPLMCQVSVIFPYHRTEIYGSKTNYSKDCRSLGQSTNFPPQNDNFSGPVSHFSCYGPGLL